MTIWQYIELAQYPKEVWDGIFTVLGILLGAVIAVSIFK